MDERKRMLATAWRDLAGWSLGMVDEWGEVSVTADWTSEIDRAGGYSCGCRYTRRGDELPDPDAPANWGVWLDSLQEQWAVDVEQTTQLGVHHFYVEVGPGTHESHCRASALLGAICNAHRKMGGRLVDEDLKESAWELPSSVTAWWEAEQSGRIPGA